MYRITQEDLDFIRKLFIQRTRDNGEKFYSFSDDVPQYIIDKIIQDDDWIIEDSCYRFAEECCCNFLDNVEVGEYENLEEIFENVRDCIEADIYTSALTEWLNESNSNVYYLTEVLEEYNPEDGFILLAEAQRRRKEEIYTIIFNMLEWYLEVEEETEE